MLAIALHVYIGYTWGVVETSGDQREAYREWRRMIATVSKSHEFPLYQVHRPWWYAFGNFFADMGNPSPGTKLKRRDNNGPYSPDNCYYG